MGILGLCANRIDPLLCACRPRTRELETLSAGLASAGLDRLPLVGCEGKSAARTSVSLTLNLLEIITYDAPEALALANRKDLPSVVALFAELDDSVLDLAAVHPRDPSFRREAQGEENPRLECGNPFHRLSRGDECQFDA